VFYRSERLFLRPGWPEDRQELLARIEDDPSARVLGARSSLTDEVGFKDLLNGAHERYLPFFLVTLPTADGARLIGCAGLARGQADPSLIFWIARDYRGQGYATESVRALLSLANALGHRRIVSYHGEGDEASARVLDKNGFRPTGECMMDFVHATDRTRPTLAYAREFDVPHGLGSGGPDKRAA